MQPSESIAQDLGIPHDDVLIFGSMHTKLLSAAAKGEIDLNQLAQFELANRGLDLDGKWVGFVAAANAHWVR